MHWFGTQVVSNPLRASVRDAAIAMLKLNGEYYPKSADIDVFLAEVLLEKGDREAAIASFRTALEKQPGHARAKQRLEELTKK